MDARAAVRWFVLPVCGLVIVSCARAPLLPTAAELADSARAIDADSARLRATSASMLDFAEGGSTITVWRADTAVRRVLAQHYGETGRMTETFYVASGQPFLVVRFREDYDSTFGRVVRLHRDSLYYADSALVRSVGGDTGATHTIWRSLHPARDTVLMQMRALITVTQ